MVEKRKTYAATWCPICENQVSEKYKDIEELLDHIRTRHPPVMDQPTLEVKQKARFGSLKTTAKRLNPFKKSSKSSVHQSLEEENRDEYRKKEKILCPACNIDAVPMMFPKRSRKFINCRLGTICLLGCWPLCFVPLMISRDKSVRMVCPLCGYDYGTYDVRNSRYSTFIVEAPTKSQITLETSSKSSRTTFNYENEQIDEMKKSEIKEKSLSSEFDEMVIPENEKRQQIGFNQREERSDAAGERTKNEENVKDAKTFPSEQFHYAAERVDRKMLPVEMETCEFCSAEIDSDSELLSRSHLNQRRSVQRQSALKCYDDSEYSTFHRFSSTDHNSPVPPICPKNRWNQKNVNDCCIPNENMTNTYDGTIIHSRNSVCNEHSCPEHNDWSCKNSSPRQNQDFYYENLYPEDH